MVCTSQKIRFTTRNEAFFKKYVGKYAAFVEKIASSGKKIKENGFH